MTANTELKSNEKRSRNYFRAGALLIALLFFGPLILGGSNVRADTQNAGEDQSSGTVNTDSSPGYTTTFTHVPTSLPGSDSVFKYGSTPTQTQSLSVDTVSFGTPGPGPLAPGGGSGGSGGHNGGKLGNAPESHYKVLQKFLQKDKAPPPNFPVPYVIYTKSDGGVEMTSDAFTKQPVMINVDDNKDTGQGGKDIRVKTTINVDPTGAYPLSMETYIELLGSPNPSYLQVTVTFPAFFYNGEAGAAGGEPYWTYGYETQPGHGIPPSILMDFAVDKSVGSDHSFKFGWTGIPASPLGFLMGIFQVLDPSSTTPNLPAFSNFVVDPLPTMASLTFGTTETPTLTRKCMNWATDTQFHLGFDFSEAESILGTPVSFDSTVNINQVPAAFSICTAEDRAAHTYSIDYTASSNVAIFSIMTDIFFGGPSTVHIDLEIDNMPAEIHVVLGAGSLSVGVSSNVGMVQLSATANLGLAEIPTMFNVMLQLNDIPSFTASWSQTSSTNSFSLDTASPSSCIGSIRFAFANGALMYPAEDGSHPTAHYLFAYSDATPLMAIALRLIGVSHIGFVQNNNLGTNTLSLKFCGNNLLYVLAHTTVGSLMTPGHHIDLRVVVDLTPTELTVSWTDPFVLTLTTNQPINSIVSDLTLDTLVAHAEILDIPANMTWTIAPSGSISFSADSSIGTVFVEAKDPNGLFGAGSFFAGAPIRLLTLTIHDVSDFTATWSSTTSGPWTSIAFHSLMGFEGLTFAVSTSQTGYATHPGPEPNRAAFYNDDSLDLGNGLVMEASLWITLMHVTRAELSWGGSPTTAIVGFGTLMAHELSFWVRLNGASALNPAAPKLLTIHVATSPLPTSMDLTLKPTESFTYSASGTIASIMADVYIGVLPDLTHVFGEIDGVPSGASGHWTANSFNLALAPSSSIGMISLIITNPVGLLGSPYKRFEVEVIGVPRSVDAAWNLATNTASLTFSDGSYGGGLGSFRALVTAQDEIPTTGYINSLGGAPASCMTTYSPFTETIDQRYWSQGQGSAASRQTLIDNIRATYCRDPKLNTVSDDYVVYLNSPSGNILALRARELNRLAATLDPNVGNAEVRFTDGAYLARQFYFRSENGGSNTVMVAEASKLPDGPAPNRLGVTWDVPGNHFTYDISEVLPFLDIYMGPTDPTGLGISFTKLLFVNVPATGSLAWDLHTRSSGFFEFLVSSEFEFGIVRQESSGTRYVAYVKMSSLHLIYSIRLPGEGPCSGSYDVCYPILHVHIDLHTHGGPVNGIFGIYERKGSLLALTPPGPSPTNPDYVPLWTFTLAGFTYFTLNIDWDAGFSISLEWCGPIPCWIDVDVTILPVISFGTDLNPWIDFWWNDNVGDSTSVVGITFYYQINVADYTNSDPVDLFPVTGLYADGPSLNVDLTEIKAGIDFELHGLHQQSDHPNPGF